MLRTDIRNIELGRELGRGAFGQVYEGRHLALSIPVAVKFVEPGPGPGNAAALDSALAEARLLARLDHANLIRIYDAGATAAGIYLVLELMDGGSLGEARRVPAEGLLDLAVQLLSALQALHDAGIVHRDVKPANCLVRRADGRVKLADLGIALPANARTALRDSIAGTVPFMAPELLSGTPRYGPQTDLYALGLTLVCLARAEDPFPTSDMLSLIDWVRSADRRAWLAERPDLPGALVHLCERLTAVDPTDRPATAAEALTLLSAPGRITMDAARPRETTQVGPWILGAVQHQSTTWIGWVATHARTGAAARFSMVRPGAPLATARASWKSSARHSAYPVILRSAELASELEHEGLVPILDWGEAEGRPYVVTAPIGRPYDEIVASAGPLDEEAAVRVGAELADALAYLHARGLVYQVVTPGGAVIGPNGRRAQLSWPMFCAPAGPAIDEIGGTRRVGVPRFMAPEAFEATAPIQPATDVYGLGEVLWYLLTGRSVFEAPTEVALALAKTEGPPSLAAVASEVTAVTARLVESLLAVSPADRPTAADARDRLLRIGRRISGR